MRLRTLAPIALGAAALLLFATPAFAGQSRDPKHAVGRSTALNWSGYAVDGTNATHVIGSWTQPAVTCSPGENSWSSPWVGIDGDISNTVEQTGTDSDCVNGIPFFYAWYEMYPKSLVLINALTVHPGDSFTGEVTYLAPTSFVLTLTDNTTHTTFTTTQSSKKADRSSVEWIMEGPSNGLLSDFGTVKFGDAAASISGLTGNLGSFPNADPITMVTRSGVPRAVPSKIGGGGRSFSVAWQHS